MSSLAHRFTAEEIPTVRRTNYAATNIALASKVDALALLAIDRLWAANDGASIAGAIAAIAEIRAAAGRVLR